jgi:glycosyltransferase involved in cell wall biosynthesis
LTSPRIVGSNTPLKIYEQIASGVPLVATRIASHTQVLDEGNCFLVDPDPRSMARGLAAALAGGEDVERRVAGARRLYQERYSPAAYRDKMRRLLALVTS